LDGSFVYRSENREERIENSEERFAWHKKPLSAFYSLLTTVEAACWNN
jgi:hypothetical protein